VERRGKEKGDEYLFNLDLFALDSVEHGIKNASLIHNSNIEPRQASSSSSSSSSSAATATATATSPMKKSKGEDDIRNAVLDEVEASGYLLGIDAKW
jgi:hypothetical protein